MDDIPSMPGRSIQSAANCEFSRYFSTIEELSNVGERTFATVTCRNENVCPLESFLYSLDMWPKPQAGWYRTLRLRAARMYSHVLPVGQPGQYGTLPKRKALASKGLCFHVPNERHIMRSRFRSRGCRCCTLAQQKQIQVVLAWMARQVVAMAYCGRLRGQYWAHLLKVATDPIGPQRTGRS